MSESIDCPICMDSIKTTSNNCVTTECGHRFHTKCLLQSVAHNGFGCPCCRTGMVEAIAPIIRNPEVLYRRSELQTRYTHEEMRTLLLQIRHEQQIAQATIEENENEYNNRKNKHRCVIS